MNNDLISREALKKAITLNRNLDRNVVCDMLDIIDNAPNIQGEWITINPILHQCSNCLEYSLDKHDYCPKCGAYMRSDNNDKK